MNKTITLGEFIIENQSAFPYSTGELSKLLNGIRLAAKMVNHEVNKAGLVDIIGGAGEFNVQGENQQKLDVFANGKFIQAIINRDIACGIVSEEEEEEEDDFISLSGNNKSNNGKYVVLMDPLDGSTKYRC
jgi:fructose-1,6-bisphosphatase I